MQKQIIFFICIFMLFTSCKNDKKAFENAKNQNTELAYTDFINGYSNSSLVAQAKILRQKLDGIEVVISSFLGSETRNYYGDSLPDKLDTIWSFYLGEGLSPAYGYDKIWKGAGWTGQSILIKEKNEFYIVQPAFDYSIRKINAKTGEVIWQYKFDDILKASPSIWINLNADKIENRYVIMQGSRKGWDKNKDSLYCWSFRAVSYITGKELWRLNSVSTASYSRDVDGSAIVINDTAYLALENGLFTVFNADNSFATKIDKYNSPVIYKQLQYYNDNDIKAHGDDLVAEASPTFLGNRIYTPSGTGWLYGYNIEKGKNDWELYIGADLNGSCPITNDNCLLLPIEKQYIKGKGGVMKIDPSKSPENSVVWFMPTDTITWLHWEGGIIGSVTVNDKTKRKNDPYIAIFTDCKGDLYIVDYMNINKDTMVYGPNEDVKYYQPKLLAKIKAHNTISTPIIVQNRILVATDNGLFLYEFEYENDNFSIKLLDQKLGTSFDATPITWNGKIYIASFTGYLLCLGRK